MLQTFLPPSFSVVPSALAGSSAVPCVESTGSLSEADSAVLLAFKKQQQQPQSQTENKQNKTQHPYQLLLLV